MYNLRPYQEDVYNKIVSAIKLKQKKILVLAATGFGKTILAYHISARAISKGNSVLFTNHRIALAKQTFDKFEYLKPELLQGENKLKDKNSLMIIASLQTLINEDITEPKIIIIDEVHYGYKGDLVQSLFKKFPNAYFIGLSATPTDDNDCLLEGWDSIIDDYQTEDLIKIGALVPFKCFAPTDIPEVKVKGNEYDESDLMEVIEKHNINKSVVDNYISIGENRFFIAFATNKKQCIELQLQFELQGVKTAIIDSNTSDKNRELYISQLKNGCINGLISIEILTAGFDEPKVSCILLATATMQWKKYIQCCGRGIRLNHDKKDCLLLDFCGNIEKHGLPDERKVFKYGRKISRVIDRQLGISEINNTVVISTEKQLYLKQIGSILDLYDGKKYKLESELQEDVNSFLKKTNMYWWRQNSGMANIQGRWVHFASKRGLPDNTLFFRNSSLYVGIELKLPTGRLTPHQLETIPEMIANNILVFIAESVFDVFMIIEHIEKNIYYQNNFLMVSNEIYSLPEKQLEYRSRLFKNKIK